MAGKPQGEAKDKLMTLRLPAKLYESVAEASEGRSVSEEIRTRLANSLAIEGAQDAYTRDVLVAISYAASKLAANTGQTWHSTRQANEAFRFGVECIIRSFVLKGDSAEPSEPDWLLKAQEQGAVLAHQAIGYLDAMTAPLSQSFRGGVKP